MNLGNARREEFQSLEFSVLLRSRWQRTRLSEEKIVTCKRTDHRFLRGSQLKGHPQQFQKITRVTPEEDGRVVCRVFKKKNLLKTLDSKKVSSPETDVDTQMLHSSRDGALEQILKYMRESSNMETNNDDDTHLSQQFQKTTRATPEEDGWVVCRVFKKKNLLKTLDSKKVSSPETDVDTQMLHSSRDRALEQILKYMRESSNMETNNDDDDDTHLAALSDNVQFTPSIAQKRGDSSNPNQANDKEQPLGDWAIVDRLVASHLNGQSDSFKQLDFFNNNNLSLLSIQDQQDLLHTHNCNNGDDRWSFTLY
ncbi:hypothetical protein MRB53_016153 [Persea americana]|uniref:Uncharacterized protein n=1 Tax=Persea americana TaxID=3435 RepID=A0ACC2M184_PERAE|nr:hypothetical protein MRB53_016153 [Persea americana]